ncbi:Anhydromuropeptide permease [Achromobacter insolitus]|jgi:PAT family beta-lactamase induction signal transducer AmpG|uniref:muropeptide transporter n=1 Tax=Achromobacter TaxID=222 RepID=UPI00097283F9|nr:MULTISPECIES: muropeptide transporter [Achromobacter]APX78298.1 MFS transporter [Achromobacter insolitus]MEB3095239.1 muropeptide transporter [Achromobacter sp. D10]CAB3655831.1 Anhydromuropeptide permease [Achromobacter insolitus]CAB3956965.1 Anhydromuropeptide permease [Achromobacter insolitus]VEG65917.1 muropeptide transporter [Achromobacter insolitus]
MPQACGRQRRAGVFQETVITVASNVYTSPRVAPLLVLGFASGLPLALTSGTLQAWATVENVPLQQIGFLTLVGSAYTLKFLWAPLVDRYAPPLLGRRRGWMLLTQLLLAVAIMVMGALSPSSALQTLALLAVLVAFLSATQDIAFDAYCTDVLRKEERGAGAAIKVMGYRLAMIVSGGLALILADQWIGWGNTYVLMGGLMLLCTLATFWAPEPENVANPPRTLREAVGEPLREFFTRRGALAVLLLIVLYKLGDAFAGALSTTFLIRGAGFTPTEVGTVNKVLGLAATIVGALAGGSIMSRWGLYRSLMAFGLLQAVSNLAYWLIAVSPKNLWLMAAGVGIENLCGGLGTASFVGLLMALCRQRFSATQFALLSALSAVGRTYLAGPLTPPLVNAMGWPGFFLLTVVIALPGLVLLHLLRGTIETMEKQGDEA